MTMNIPFHRPSLSDDEITSVVESLRSGWITMGEKTLAFEKKFIDYLSMPNAVSVNSGTAALHLALKAIGLCQGDEVLIPAITFVATAEVVRYFDAVPVMVDVEKDTHLIDVKKLEEKITSKTRAIIPVHYAGQPCDMDELMVLAETYNIRIIEDAAHAFPAWYKNRKIGTIGDITCYSFYATKTITTGEGGMAVTGNTEWADIMKTLRLHGISKDAWNRYIEKNKWGYDVTEMGYKYNMTDLNAAIGLCQFDKAEAFRDERRAIAEIYDEQFKDREELVCYTIKNDRASAYHLYPLKLNLEALGINRDDFITEMSNRNIGTSVHFIPLYRFSYYKDLGYKAEDFPISEWIFERMISLPVYPGMSKEQVAYVVENVLDIAEKNKR